MTVAITLTDYLEKNHVPYEIVLHPKTFRAAETADSEHVPRGEFAKVVMVKIKGEDAMCVIPSNCRLDTILLAGYLGTSDIRLEREHEFTRRFSDCEAGAMPPFGALYNIPCYVDARIEIWNDVVFNGGGHEESIKIKTQDYLRVAQAKLCHIAAKD